MGTTIFTFPIVISSFIFYSYYYGVCLFSNVCHKYVFLVLFFKFMIFFSPETYVDSVGATIFTFRVVIQLNVFIAVPDHFVFGKAKFSYYKFQLEEGNTVNFHARYENDLKTNKKKKQNRKAFGRQKLQYSRKICLRLTVFVLNQVRVCVSGAYRHTQHAQTRPFIQKIIDEEKIFIST